MNAKLLQRLLSDYTQMSVDSLIELKNLIEDYPYCQTAQILYLLNLKRLGEDTFDTRLPHTAVCVHSRQRLKENVAKIEELLAQEGRKSSKKHLPENNGEITAKQNGQVDQQKHLKPALELKSFQNKTISDLLNLSNAEPSTTTKIKLPKPTADDLMLERLRQEAIAKVNQRLQEIRQTSMVDVDFVETAKKMDAAQDLINKVIATNPKISKVNDSDVAQKPLKYWKVKEEHSLRDDYEVVSETLAQLYIKQGAPAKAREIYKTLSKKFPEKADYFADLGKRITPARTSKTSVKSTKTISTQIKSNHKPKIKK